MVGVFLLLVTLFGFATFSSALVLMAAKTRARRRQDATGVRMIGQALGISSLALAAAIGSILLFVQPAKSTVQTVGVSQQKEETVAQQSDSAVPTAEVTQFTSTRFVEPTSENEIVESTQDDTLEGLTERFFQEQQEFFEKYLTGQIPEAFWQEFQESNTEYVESKFREAYSESGTGRLVKNYHLSHSVVVDLCVEMRSRMMTQLVDQRYQTRRDMQLLSVELRRQRNHR